MERVFGRAVPGPPPRPHANRSWRFPFNLLISGGNEEETRFGARLGVASALLLALDSLLAIAFVIYRSDFWNERTAPTLIAVSIIFLAEFGLIIFAAWWIWQRQSRWACCLVLADAAYDLSSRLDGPDALFVKYTGGATLGVVMLAAAAISLASAFALAHERVRASANPRRARWAFSLVFAVALAGAILVHALNASAGQERATRFASGAMTAELLHQRVEPTLEYPESAAYRNVALSGTPNHPHVCGEVASREDSGAMSGFRRFVATSTGRAVILPERPSPRLAAMFQELWDKACTPSIERRVRSVIGQ